MRASHREANASGTVSPFHRTEGTGARPVVLDLQRARSFRFGTDQLQGHRRCRNVMARHSGPRRGRNRHLREWQGARNAESWIHSSSSGWFSVPSSASYSCAGIPVGPLMAAGITAMLVKLFSYLGSRFFLTRLLAASREEASGFTTCTWDPEGFFIRYIEINDDPEVRRQTLALPYPVRRRYGARERLL